MSIGKKGGRTIKKQDLIKIGEHYVVNSEENYLKQTFTSKTVREVRIFARPVFAFGAADDEYFTKFKDPTVIGEHYLTPRQWLPEANTIVSYFLPFSQEIRKGNSIDPYWPSEEWLDGFAEGQFFLNKLGLHLQSELIKAGYDSLVPSLDKRFLAKTGLNNNDLPGAEGLYTSNWSERHAAFVCGLGTFGLSKALITRSGLAGRFGSLITALDLPADLRPYGNLKEYCSMCGKCAKNCPANAISIEEGKNHQICSEYLGKTLEKYRPRYGCGKCQINVPCESGIPKN